MTAVLQGNPAIPEAEHTIPASTDEYMDTCLNELQQAKTLWTKMSIPLRIALLEELMDTVERHAQKWVDVSLKAKGIPLGSPAEGEEWLAGPGTVMRHLRLMRNTLRDIHKHGAPKLPGKPFARSNGQVVVPVLPTDVMDSLAFTGFRAEVWMQPEVTLSNLNEHIGATYQKERREGKVALVLGAGNVSSIGPLDALYKLYMEDQVVILKMNPVNEYLGPVFEEVFKPFSNLDFFRVVYGGAKEGAYLCQHEAVEEIHITGSDKTHDAIVFGPGEKGQQRKAHRQPQVTKRITSELGNVTPVIVVPGPWSEGDFAFQGANIATQLANNGGFNCNALRVIVNHKSWDLRKGLSYAVERTLSQTPVRKAYYPGARDRFEKFIEAHPDAKQFGTSDAEHVPWTIVPGLDSNAENEICFGTESFCGVGSEALIEAGSVVEYIDKAVEFCNEKLWGTLSCSIIVHPKSMKEPEVKEAVERAIANLRYGSVAINHWSALSYAFASTTWGAFPGHDLYDIRSGIGVVHNTYMLEKPQKSVVYGPFNVFPKPAWFVTNKQAPNIGRKLIAFEKEPSLVKLPGIIASAIQG